jgi:2-keto-4-pentenoate hydratase/2-oxohepta-3-ene-1,7-dioic acid hydratase in catechol pathway
VRLVSFRGGFGRIDGETVVPMGSDIITYLAGIVPTEDGAPIALTKLQRLPPVPNPRKIICVGLNYHDHAVESGQPIPSEPVLFAKYANSLIGTGADIVVPEACSAVDYEAELGVVIGKRASRVSTQDALDHVAGYLCLNDVSDRALQARGGQWTHGKAIDTFMPAGPWLVTPDAVGDPQNLSIRCLVNGDIRQASSTSEMIFKLPEIVSFISATTTLLPGDIIATGTPHGVGMGFVPPRYLAPGDEIVVEIDGLGQLRNRIRRETDADRDRRRREIADVVPAQPAAATA